MKNFFKIVLANIIAIFIFGFLISMMFVVLLMLGAAGDNPSVKVKKNSVLTLDFRTHLIDSPTEDKQDLFGFNSKENNVLVYDVVDAILKAAKDDNIKGISIETDQISAGITQLDDVRAALSDFRKSGKFVYAYGNSVSQGTYYLGSVAEQYILNPAGGIDLKGLGTEVTFVKDFAAKYGIGIEVIRHGKYKAAVEPFLRNDISPENKEQLSVLLNDLWGNISGKIAASRKISNTEFQVVADSLYGVIPDLSLKYKLADKMLQKSQYDDLIRNKLGLKEKDKLNKISFSNYISSLNSKKGSDPEVAILYASGSINNGEGYDGIYAEDFKKEIQELAKNDDVKAVVFRINSPGGSANASDEILFELEKLKAKKPVVISFGDYAASGGYYIAMAGNKIFAEPNTLTGSIGVFGVVYNFEELANRNGIRSDIVDTNANSLMHSPLHGLSAGGVSIMNKSVEQTYRRFVHFVTQNRKQSFEQIDAIGGGRVWSGKRAKELGLVDELGTLQDAVAYAAKSAKMSTYSTEAYPKKKTAFEQFFGNMDSEQLSERIVKARLGKDQYEAFQMLTNPKMQSGVMMAFPYKVGL